MPRNQIILLKIILLLSYFENEEVIQLFYLSPESLFAVNFGTDTHTACLTRGTKLSSIRLRYRTKLLLWLLIRFGLSNLRVPLQINVFLQTSRVSTMKSTYAPAGNVHNYPFPVCKWQYYDCVFQCCAVCDDTLRLDLQIIDRDMHVKWYYDSCCAQSFKNNPMPGYILIYRSPKRSYIERMVLYFLRFLLLDPRYLCFNGAKNCHI